jgi:hypothetical protein
LIHISLVPFLLPSSIYWRCPELKTCLMFSSTQFSVKNSFIFMASTQFYRTHFPAAYSVLTSLWCLTQALSPVDHQPSLLKHSIIFSHSTSKITSLPQKRHFSLLPELPWLSMETF